MSLREISPRMNIWDPFLWRNQNQLVCVRSRRVRVLKRRNKEMQNIWVISMLESKKKLKDSMWRSRSMKHVVREDSRISERYGQHHNAAEKQKWRQDVRGWWNLSTAKLKTTSLEKQFQQKASSQRCRSPSLEDRGRRQHRHIPVPPWFVASSETRV